MAKVFWPAQHRYSGQRVSPQPAAFSEYQNRRVYERVIPLISWTEFLKYPPKKKMVSGLLKWKSIIEHDFLLHTRSK